MKTIKELADELGVSKTAVRKHMTEDFRAQHTAILPGNIIGIDEDGCKLITESLRKPPVTGGNSIPETPENPGLREEVAFLREQLLAKDRQLEAKDRQIEAQQTQLAAKDTQIGSLTAALEHTTASLQAAQALHAGTMQQQLESGEPQAEATIEVDGQEQAEPAPKWWQFRKKREWKGK